MAEKDYGVEEPIVVTPKQELPVPTFNYEEIKAMIREEVAKAEVKIKEEMLNTPESYPEATEILVDGVQSHELTPEIETFIKKCFEVQKINYQGYLMSLNFAFIADGKIRSLCFGCQTVTANTSHGGWGSHCEITCDYDTDPDNPTYNFINNEV